jgi:hypothetical protein
LSVHRPISLTATLDAVIRTITIADKDGDDEDVIYVTGVKGGRRHRWQASKVSRVEGVKGGEHKAGITIKNIENENERKGCRECYLWYIAMVGYFWIAETHHKYATAFWVALLLSNFTVFTDRFYIICGRDELYERGTHVYSEFHQPLIPNYIGHIGLPNGYLQDRKSRLIR